MLQKIRTIEEKGGAENDRIKGGGGGGGVSKERKGKRATEKSWGKRSTAAKEARF